MKYNIIGNFMLNINIFMYRHPQTMRYFESLMYMYKYFLDIFRPIKIKYDHF